MITGDDWFMKTMLINTLSRSEKLRSQTGTTTSSTDNLFAAVLQQFLEGREDQSSSIEAQLSSFSPNFMISNSTLSGMPDNLVQNNETNTLSYQSQPAEQLNQSLSGKLKGMGQVFVTAGQQYNIDPSLLAAIAKHESANGKSKAAAEKNNIAGMMGINGLKSYASIEDSIMDMARNLSKNYLAKGLTTISDIGNKYAPVGASNDPTGLNNHWVAGVTKYYQELKTNQLV